MEIIFLGTGGGRFSTITQARRTGGIRILFNKLNIHLDPGPGSLVYSIEANLDPRKINAILVSHCHPDHYTDLEPLIEAMTFGATKRVGHLVCSKSITVGNDVCGPCISRYHKNLLGKVSEFEAGNECQIDRVKIRATKALHSDPSTVGFILSFPEVGVVGYTSDTEYFEGVGYEYKGVDLLILCTMRPRGSPWKGHMSTDDAVKILIEAKPKRAILTHFGLKMLTSNPDLEAKYVEKSTNIPTSAAKDGMRVKMEKRSGDELTKFF